MHRIIDGKKLAENVIAETAKRVAEENLSPQLAVILVGNDPASNLYVKLKERACLRAGIGFHKYYIDESDSEERVLETIRFLNTDADIDAILIQLPLPSKFNQQKIIEALDWRKDVDGFHPNNIASFLAGKPQKIMPGLSLAIWRLIESCGSEHFAGKKGIIIGKSEAFTKPTQKLLGDNGIVADIVAPTDPALQTKTLNADILITAIGAPGSITAAMVKNDAIIVDVGISKQDGKTVGDVDFDHVAPKCSFITPVPGGVGPITVAMLLYNTVALARLRFLQ